MTQFEINQFIRDYRATLALSDARKAESAAARERCKANRELVAHLTAEATRRGEAAIAWAEYFRNIGL